MIEWEEDDLSKIYIKAALKKFIGVHILPDTSDFEIQTAYARGIDNILKNGSTAILDVQHYAGKALKKFYHTMVKYKDFLELENVFDEYSLLVRGDKKLPKNIMKDILEISKLEYEYLGSCTFGDFLEEVQKTVSDKAYKRHLREFKRKVRNGDFQ